MALHPVGKYSFLALVSVLEKFLDNVVAKNILHQLQGFRLQFFEYALFLITVCCLQLLLNEPRPMLVSTELNYVVVNILFDISYCRRVKMKWVLGTFNSYRLLVLLFDLNSCNKALRRPSPS